ncbi:hypothetical protein OIU78_001604 [Salix suchowensis]|nr:hypothetical protein OIU78_001604 [Salix suchowensis]
MFIIIIVVSILRQTTCVRTLFLLFFKDKKIINNARTQKQAHSKQIPLPLLSQLKIPLENQGMANAKLISTLLLCMVVTAPVLHIEASIVDTMSHCDRCLGNVPWVPYEGWEISSFQLLQRSH